MDELQINRISLTRFNALGGYARVPGSWNVFDELDYFEVEGGDVIGIATKDLTDQDFGGIVLAKDEKLRFRGVNVTEFCPTPEAAKDKFTRPFAVTRVPALKPSRFFGNSLTTSGSSQRHLRSHWSCKLLEILLFC